jgi:hypothetical protein
MQLGKTLVGAIIGGALGVALLFAAQYFQVTDKAWLAIPVALLTGLGVRSMVSTAGHASYLRGALTALLALTAYVGATYLYSELATRGALAGRKPVTLPADAPAGDAPVDATAEAVDAEVGKADAGEAATEDEETVDTEGGDTAAQENVPDITAPADADPVPANGVRGVDPAIVKRPPRQQPSAWDYLWLTVAALLAYELGRGTSAAALRREVVPPPDAT